MKNHRLVLACTSIGAAILVTAAFLIASTSYFHKKEIESLTSQCYANDGTPVLTIYSKLSNSYSFSCETKNM